MKIIDIYTRTTDFTQMDGIQVRKEPTESQKKRSRFGTMFMLHQLLNRANVKHENAHTLTCMGYVKSKERF